MGILNRHNIFHTFLTLVSVFVFLSGEVNGQVATNSGSGLAPAYGSLAAAITALNGATITSPVIITLTGNETAPPGGYSITSQGTAANTIIIQGSGSIITADGPQLAGSRNDGIFKIIGGDYITLQNFTMVENPANTEINPGTNNMTEWGVALLYATTTNGAKNNTIQNNTISLNSTYTNSVAVYSNVRHAAGTPLTLLEISAATGNNSNNRVYGNTISNVACPVVFVGSNNTAAMDSGNDIGGSSVSTGNTITSWGNNVAYTGAFPFTAAPFIASPTTLGIFTANQLVLNIGYNNLTGNALVTTMDVRGIHVFYSTTPTTGTFTHTITNNTITLRNALISLNYEVIKTEGMASLATATININNNSVLNCLVTGGFSGISNSSIPGALNINSNIIRGTISGSVNQTNYGIRNTGAASVYINIKNNQLGNIDGNFITYTAASSGELRVISNEPTLSPNSCTFYISGNRIQGIDQTMAVGTNIHNYIYNTYPAKFQNIDSNTFTNISANTNGNVYFINNSVSIQSIGIQNVLNNSIGSTGFSKTASSGTVYLYSSGVSVSNSSTIIHSNNNFSKITLTGNTVMQGWKATGATTTSPKTFSNNTFTNWLCGTGRVFGFDIGTGNYIITNNIITNIKSSGYWIYCIHTSTNGLNVTISKNTIGAISNTNKIVCGIYSEAPSATISKNKIYDISNSNSFPESVNGIRIKSSGGTGTFVTLSNNYVGDIKTIDADHDNAMQGIKIEAANTLNAYNNTVWLNASQNRAAAFGTSAIYVMQVNQTNFFNNIFVNNSVPKNAGDVGARTIAYRRQTSITATNYTGNNNLFYAGLPGIDNVIYMDSNSVKTPNPILNIAVTLDDFKYRLTNVGNNSDNASITENPPFVSTVGTDPQFLHINNGCVSPPTYIESGGIRIAGITDDFDGDLRWGETSPPPGYTGLGAAPDIGADEFNSQSILVTSSAGTITPTSYNTLKAAFAKINNGTHQENIVMKLYCSTVESGRAVLNPNLIGAAKYTKVTIYPMLPGLSISSSQDSALIDFNGATNVTIDGRVNGAGQPDLRIIHTGTNTTSRNILFRNSARNNKIIYCKINGSCSDPVSGVIYFSPSSSIPGNDNNLIDRCEFSNSGTRPLNIIFSDGASSKDNSGNTISNNTFYNFLNPVSASNGIFIRDFSTAWTITGNSFYENTTLSPTLQAEYSAIRILNTYGSNFTISGNYIGGSAGQCTGGPFTKTNSYTNTFYGIYFNALNTTPSSIQGNTIRNFSWSNSGAADWTGIYIGGSGTVNVGTVSGNTIGSASGTGSIVVNNGNTLNRDVVGIKHESSGAGFINNNIIGSITSGHSSPFSTSLYGILKSAGIGAVIISNNSIGSVTTANSINATSVSTGNAQLVYGICNTTPAGCTINGNSIGNLTNASTNSSSSLAGISLSGGSTNSVSKNFIYGLQSTTAAPSIYGINVTTGAGTYSNNIISLGTVVTSGCVIYGISENSSLANNVYFNTVYIGGEVASGTNSSWAMYSGNSNTRDFRNNIFYNNRTGGGKHYAIGLTSKTGLAINYNDYYTAGSILGQFNGTDQANISAWRGITAQDVNSLNLNPVFPGAGGTVESGYLPSVALSGIVGTGITTDYYGIIRSTPPTMGALESVAIATTSLTPITVCTSNTLNVCFTSTGAFAAGNTFKAQLSDISGNFGAPTDLLPVLTNSLSGAQCMNVLIPAATAPGSGYRIRVISSSPANINDAGLTIEIHQSATLSFTKTDVTCSGLPIGAINLTVGGGTGPFTFSWAGSAGGVVPGGQSTNQNLTGLVAGTYTVSVTGNYGCTSIVSVPIVVSTLPAVPTLTATLPCVGNKPIFTAGNGSKYQFFFNGISQGSPSAINTFTPSSNLANNDMVCVRSFWPFVFDGIMAEPSWGAPLATSAGGPATSGFGAGNNIDAIYIKSDPDYIFGGIAGNLGDNSGNRVLLFIDSKTGGYNNIGAWTNRWNSPCRSIENLNNGITFDMGFEPDYILAINQANGGEVYYNLYDMAGNSDNYLGSKSTSTLLGFTANSGIGAYDKGFEFAIPRTALGNPGGAIKVFAMITNNPDVLDPTYLSNQFLTRAGSAEGNYMAGPKDFGFEIPDPINVTLSDIDCYSETCITIHAVTAPTANNVTACYDGLSQTATASTPGASIKYFTLQTGGALTTAPTSTAVGVYSAWAEATDSTTSCVSASRTQVTLTIKERPVVSPIANQRYCNGEAALPISFNSTPAGGTFNWTSSSDVGFGTANSGNIGIYTAINSTNEPITAVLNVTVTSLNNCTSLPMVFNDTVFPSPLVNSLPNKVYCNGDAAPAIYFSSPTSGTVHYIWTSDVNIGASGVDSIVFAPVNNTAVPIVSTVTVSASAYGCSGPGTQFTITINPSPVPTIKTDYCSIPNRIVLTAQPLDLTATYLWNTTVSTYTDSTIIVDKAGNFGVVVTNSAGCQGSAYLNLGTELVTDGSFTNFKATAPVFFSEYRQNQYYYDGVYDASGLIQPNKYAVNINAWSNQPSPFPATPLNKGYHRSFHGRDHTNNTVGPRNFMMVNGSDSLVSSPPPIHPAIIWQQTVHVKYRSDYYFSAWAMNLSVENNAILRFEINGEKVGTILNLASSPKPRTEGEVDITNWNRFYNTTLWTPKNAGDTIAVIRIVNLNTAFDGNNFGLDDISFGALASIPDASSANANGGGTVCVGDDLYFAVDSLHGGTLPYAYEWRNPGDTIISTDPTAFIAAAQSINSGNYTLIVTDANGCHSLPAITLVAVIPFPVSPTSALVDRASVCTGDLGTINLSVSGGSGSIVRWFTGDCGISGIYKGSVTPPQTKFTIPSPLTTTTYYARWETDCDSSACVPVTVTVGSKWEGSVNANWNDAGNWSGGCGVPDATKDAIIPNVSNKPQINIIGAECRNLTIDPFSSLAIKAGQALTINGNLTNNGALTISSDALNNNGSLIVLGSGSGSGSITYNRYLETNRWFITSPSLNNSFTVLPSNIGQVGGTYNFAPYTESNNDGWTYLLIVPPTLTVGKGYLLKLAAGTTVQYSGTLNDDISLSVPSSGPDDGWNAIGNPYTSALRIVDELPNQGFIWQNRNTLDPNYQAVYVWNETGPPDQYYKVICNALYTGKQYGGILTTQKYVQPGQGFLVNIKYNSGAPGTIKFTHGTSLITGGMQVHSPSTNTFLKSSETNTSWPGITLLASGNGKTCSTVIAFNSNMTTGLDPSYDAGMLSTTDFNLYTHLVDGSNATDFMVQCLPDTWNDTLAVPIGVDLPTAGLLTFKAAGVILPDGLYPVIEDRLLQLSVPLKTENDSLIVGMAEPTWGIGRFYLHIGGALSTVGNSNANDSPKISAYFNDQKITVLGLPEQGSRAWLCDMSGRKLSGEYRLTSANRNEISAAGLASGIYLLKIEGKTGRQTIKVTVLNR